MVGHDDVAEDIEIVALSQFFECFLEEDAGVLLLKPRLVTIATEVDGVVMAVLLISLQAARHGEDSSVDSGGTKRDDPLIAVSSRWVGRHYILNG